MDWFKSSRGKKTEDYEKGYLTRYKKGQKVKPKKKASKIKQKTKQTNASNANESKTSQTKAEL